MAISSRDDFKEYCLRKLGKPVIEINVDDDQVEDRVDEALKYYWDYHFDGTEKVFYKKEITAEDVANKYITMPQNIIGAVRIFDIGDYLATNNIFNIRYQIALNDLYTLTYQSMVPYYMAFQQIQLLEQLLVGKQPIRYNRNVNKLYVDMNWEKVSAGYYLIVEAYSIVDPNEFTDVWNDRFLKKYTTALIKRQWGANLKKFAGIQMPGGVTLNGQVIYDEAIQEIEKMEEEIYMMGSLPSEILTG